MAEVNIRKEWVEVSHLTIPASTWRREVEHRLKMASVEYGYVGGHMYVPQYIIDAIHIWSRHQMGKTMSLDIFLIKTFGTKDLSKK